MIYRAQGLFRRSSDAVMIEESIQQAVLEARNLAHGIFPVHVDRNGLSTALSDLARVTSRLTGVNIRFEESSEVHLDNPEFVHASLPHRPGGGGQRGAAWPGRKRSSSRLNLTPENLELRIDDDGVGMLEAKKKNGAGMGLRTMRYRAQILGAPICKLQPRAGGGTSVTCLLPSRLPPTP
jgi:signal transduction histidine kinase